MPEGIVNKNTILVFSNYTSMKNYIPTSINKIGIDDSTGNYYIFNGSKWILFKENILQKATMWWPLPFMSSSTTLSSSGATVTQSYTSSQNRVFMNIQAGTSDYFGAWRALFGIAVTASTANTMSFGGAGSGITGAYDGTPTYVGFNATGSVALIISASVTGS